jgi:hypothetical protein
MRSDEGATVTTATYGRSAEGASVQEVLRLLRSLQGVGDVTQVTPGTPLERTVRDADPPRIESAIAIEGDAIVARALPAAPDVGFSAFLDGIQASRVISQHGLIPIVHGTAAAVVRERRDRVLRTAPGALRITRAVFVPVARCDPAFVAALRQSGVRVEDTLDGDPGEDAQHPLTLHALARTAVQRAREAAEVALAEAWCAAPRGALYVDGGISGAGSAAKSADAIGVVKSHRTLYAGRAEVATVLGLAVGERTTAFEIRSPRRAAVASWYLRLHDPRGRDPFFGLVRVESASQAFSPARADLISRWVLAERAPVALPDARWSTMAYGIRDCEEYLRAVTA